MSSAFFSAGGTFASPLSLLFCGGTTGSTWGWNGLSTVGGMGTLQFNAGATPLEDLHPNTGIEISGGNNNVLGNVDSIKKFYALNEPDPTAPCCGVTQPCLTNLLLRPQVTLARSLLACACCSAALSWTSVASFWEI